MRYGPKQPVSGPCKSLSGDGSSDFILAIAVNVTNAQNCKRTENPLVLPGEAYKNLIFFQFLCEPVIYNHTVFLPDLQITVNFTDIAGIIASAWSFFPQVSIPISIGLTNSHSTKSIEDIFARKAPISLIPGMNIVAPYKIQARQLFTHRALAALGTLQVRATSSSSCHIES
jgi:hypothetical protein